MHHGFSEMHHALVRDAPKNYHSIKVNVQGHKNTVFLTKTVFFVFRRKIVFSLDRVVNNLETKRTDLRRFDPNCLRLLLQQKLQY